MDKFIKGAGSVLIAVVLAMGWTWTELLKSWKLIDDRQQTYGLIVLTVLLMLQQIYLVLPKPVNRSIVEGRRKIIEDYLRDFHAQYYKVMKSLYHDTAKVPPVVRVNVMLPTRRFKGLWGAYLKIYYFICPGGVIYTDKELAQKWSKENGTCGWAWVHKDITVYDSQDVNYMLPAKRLKKEQLSIGASIKSTLSVPIWYNEGVFGVLNIDSTQNISDTMFTHERVYTLAAACAEVLSGLCFEDGVQA